MKVLEAVLLSLVFAALAALILTGVYEYSYRNDWFGVGLVSSLFMIWMVCWGTSLEVIRM